MSKKIEEDIYNRKKENKPFVIVGWVVTGIIVILAIVLPIVL